MDKELQLMLDKDAIKEVMAKYSYYADTKDWETFRTVFDDIITVDYSSFDPNAKLENVSADEFIKNNSIPTLDHLKASQHVFTNFIITVDGDTAHGIMYCRAQHYKPGVIGESTYEVGGHYHIDYVRREDGWKIRNLVANFTWFTGNVGVTM